MKRKQEGDPAEGRWSPRVSKYKRRKKSHRSSPIRYSSPTEQRVQTGGRSRRSTGDVDLILSNFRELLFRFEEIEEKLNSIQYQLRNIERFVANITSVQDNLKNIQRCVENEKPLQQEKRSQLCILM